MNTERFKISAKIGYPYKRCYMSKGNLEKIFEENIS